MLKTANFSLNPSPNHAAALHGIKEVGGVTIAQKPETAKQPDMPESAIDSGRIDYMLSPEVIAQAIVRITTGD
jgi:chemotaxis response regulator CheB